MNKLTLNGLICAEQIELGYERMDEWLNALDARITRVPARAR